MNIPKPDGNVGVVVGRFQVNELHEGHRNLLDWVTENYNQMIVVLGVSAICGSRSNPIPATIRAEMIRSEYPTAIIVSLSDTRSNEQWSKNLDIVISQSITPNQKPVLFGSRDSFIPYYTGRYTTQELVGNNSEFWTGTEIRKRISESPLNHNSPQFRAGVIYGSAAVYPRCIPTVDVAVIKNESVYLVRKHGEEKFRFCGGYAEPGNGSYEIDAKREIREEIGDIEVSKMNYIGSYDIDDWRYRSDIDNIRTTFFMTEYVYGPIGPKDTNEIADVRMFHLTNDNIESIIVEEHKQLLQDLKLRMKGNKIANF
jgi:bifunctional NMN adenylyltransferase/nudix hydrolase